MGKRCTESNPSLLRPDFTVASLPDLKSAIPTGMDTALTLLSMREDRRGAMEAAMTFETCPKRVKVDTGCDSSTIEASSITDDEGDETSLQSATRDELDSVESLDGDITGESKTTISGEKKPIDCNAQSIFTRPMSLPRGRPLARPPALPSKIVKRPKSKN